ncbi:MAG: iron-sulfur cluster assembly scaffold protein [Candidatus Saganbacteria bacterium]|nr:iron-sulfur cluster assembly scaffold protein [Candidatus Saganbacteria bacterium]
MDDYFGRMNDPSASSYVKGLCGEEMEFYLFIKDGVIIEAKYYTEGCEATRSCAAAAAALALGRTGKEAMKISAGEVAGLLGKLPAEHTHCAILAVMALYKALADYLLKL